MNERDLDEFLNDPGDLFVRQCEQLWQEMWTISNDGEHSMALRNIAEAISLYLELPGIYDHASTAEQGGIQPILMRTWTAIVQPLEDFSEIPPGPHPAGIAEAAQRARELIDALEGWALFPLMRTFWLPRASSSAPTWPGNVRSRPIGDSPPCNSRAYRSDSCAESVPKKRLNWDLPHGHSEQCAGK